MEITIIDYGAGNVRSVEFALKRLGVKSMLTNDPESISKAEKLIFPGVGQAKTAMKQLKKHKLDEVIPNLKQPVLGICLGMQLLCDFSEEGGIKGLGVFDQTVQRFETPLKVPHTGWNELFDLRGNLFKGVLENAYSYFVHSYFVPIGENTVATAQYDISFSAALQNKNFYGCQFHPEKSGVMGSQILKNFIEL